MTTARPRWWYWLGLPPAAATVGLIGAVVIGLPLAAAFDPAATARVFVVALVAFSLVAGVLIARADYRRLRFELTDDEFVLGRGTGATHVPLAQVRRAVVGLPPARGYRASAILGGNESALTVHRLRTLVLVLDDGSVLPLSLTRWWLRGGRELDGALRRRLVGHLTGSESYGPAELALLSRARVRLNVISPARSSAP